MEVEVIVMTRLNFVLWEMKPEMSELTCNMIFHLHEHEAALLAGMKTLLIYEAVAGRACS